MHSFVTSKNVTWPRLIWPTLYVGWNSSKIISPPNNYNKAYARADPNMGDLVQREHPKNWGGIGVWSLEHKNLQYLRNGAR